MREIQKNHQWVNTERNKSMNRAELAKEIAEDCGIGVKKVERIIDRMIWVMSKVIQHGEDIKMQGFGTLKPIVRAARKRHDVATGEMVDAPEKRTVKFVPSRVFLETLN